MAVYALKETHHISSNSVDLIVWKFLHIFLLSSYPRI